MSNLEVSNLIVWQRAWLLVRMFPASFCWLLLGVVLAVQDWPADTVLGLPAGLLLLLACGVWPIAMSLFRWTEEFEWLAIFLPRGDWRRWQDFRAERKNRLAGYSVAYDLALVLPVPDEVLRRPDPRRKLPGAELEKHGDRVELLVVQERAATTVQVIDRAEAYAPVLGSKPEWTKVERLDPDLVRITWALDEPFDPLGALIPFERTEAAGRRVSKIDPMRPLPIGRREDGTDFLLQIFGRQILLVGSSGSGKGSVLWSIILGLAPAIQEGTVKLYGVDLKGGVEFALGRSLFARLAFDYGDAIKVLEEVQELTAARLQWMRENSIRKFETPTPENPLVLLILDEAGSLTYQAPDAKTRNRADELLKAIVSTGRAPGVAVLAALQDPRQDALPSRNLFLDVLALRMKKSEVALALPPGSYDAGAQADRIPVKQPGTGYAINNETGEVERFRAFWVPDRMIRQVAEVVPASASEG